MTSNSTHFDRPPKQPKPAWLFSVLIHVTVIGLLCFVFHTKRGGAGDAHSGSVGIVLHHANAAGDQEGSIHRDVRQALATAEDLTAPLLLAANDTPATSSEERVEQPAKSTTTGSKPGAAKPDSKKKTSAGTAAVRAQLSSGGGNGYAQVSVFGVQGKGNKFIYVFDRSGSMDGAPLATAKKQLIDSLQSLDNVQQFHIIFFNTRTQAFDGSGGGRRIAFATDRNKRLAANFVGGITADGGTDRMAALHEAINLAPDVIFFLTDADDAMSPEDLAKIAKANRKVQATICVIEFGKKPAPVPNNFLARLAQESGGQYGYIDTTKLK